jgi:outer membrane lipoprotein-sorting protein
MDARALLKIVADTYAKMQSFEVEILSTVESDDDEEFHRSRQRARAFFVAPDKVRIEQSGRRGIVTVSDGVDHHQYFIGPKQYWTSAAQLNHLFAGAFRPESPLTAGIVFLFPRMAERVALAEILKEDDSSVVVSVTYDSSPDNPVSASPIVFWIDKRTHLVSRMEGEVTHRFPHDDESHTMRNEYEYAHAFLNQPIPAQTFEYVPPADAVDGSSRRPGSGTSNHRLDEKKRFETWHHASWEGEIFFDRFELKIRGLELNFERRLSFADTELLILEKITGPKGSNERQFSIPATAD